MKRIILLTVFLMPTIWSFAQCKLKVDKVDEFKKIRLRETKYQNIYNGFSTARGLQLIQHGEDLLLRYVLTAGFKDKIEMNEGDELNIKCVDDSVITLYASKLLTAKADKSLAITMTEIKADYKISVEQLNYFKQHPPVRIRFNAGEEKDETDVNQNKWKQFEVYIECIISLYEKDFK